MANTRKATTASSPKNFKKRVAGRPLPLPSGEVALVKRPGMEKLLSAGLMPDSLTPVIQKQIESAQRGEEVTPENEMNDEVLQNVLQDPARVAEIFTSFDKITAMCVVEPKTRLHTWLPSDPEVLAGHRTVGEEIDEDDRDEEILYTDEIDSMDKMFIFQYVVGGSSDLEQFRRQYGASLEGLES
jgi:hypothetical protein